MLHNVKQIDESTMKNTTGFHKCRLTYKFTTPLFYIVQKPIESIFVDLNNLRLIMQYFRELKRHVKEEEKV